jgi:hypothetical protein
LLEGCWGCVYFRDGPARAVIGILIVGLFYGTCQENPRKLSILLTHQ